MTKQKESKLMERKSRLDEIFDKGIDANEYSKALGIEALTGGEDNILFECNEQQALIYAIMDAICYPRLPDGSIDWVIAYDDPVLFSMMMHAKYNMKSNKRKGLMELTDVLKPAQDEEVGITGRIKDAITGAD